MLKKGKCYRMEHTNGSVGINLKVLAMEKEAAADSSALLIFKILDKEIPESYKALSEITIPSIKGTYGPNTFCMSEDLLNRVYKSYTEVYERGCQPGIEIYDGFTRAPAIVEQSNFSGDTETLEGLDHLEALAKGPISNDFNVLSSKLLTKISDSKQLARLGAIIDARIEYIDNIEDKV